MGTGGAKEQWKTRLWAQKLEQSEMRGEGGGGGGGAKMEQLRGAKVGAE